MTVETLGENLDKFPEEKTSDEDVSTMIAETLEALNEARENLGASENEVLGGIEGELEKLAAAMDAASPQNGEVKVDLPKRQLKSSKMPHELQMS